MSVIQFFTPLTVIVGHNGSGKTTIIECLKYATTGDLPPNTKGGAFVHDPSIAGVSEVKAQVKLRFSNTRKQLMTIERRLQVTKKKAAAGLSMKTLEANITLVEGASDKKRHSLSTKCAALEEECAIQLGVSKAILENVIFCHQEESNWPLAEPASLKKKFDDIFEATKYTKALDQIKSIRKDQAVKIKVDNEKVHALKIDRDRAAKLRTAIEASAHSIQVKTAEHEELEQEIQNLVEKNRKFFDQASQYQDIIGKADTLRIQRGHAEKNVQQLRANIQQELSQETDAELKGKIANHESDLNAKRTERGNLDRQLQDLNEHVVGHQRRVGKLQELHGKLLAQFQRHEENLEARQILIRELSAKHEIAGFDHELNDDEMKQFENKLTQMIQQQNTKIDRVRREVRANERKFQQEIQALKSEQAAGEGRKRNIADNIAKCKDRIQAINRKLETMTTTIGEINFNEQTLKNDEARKLSLEEQIQSANFAVQLANKTREVKELEEERENLHLELTNLNLQAEVRAQLAVKRTDLKKKNDSIQSILEQSAPKFVKLTNKDPTAMNMEPELNAISQRLQDETIAAERVAREMARELQSVELKISSAKQTLKDLQTKSSDNKRKIERGLTNLGCTETRVDAALETAQTNLNGFLADLAELQDYVKFYDKLISKGRDKQKCIGCNRHLDVDEMEPFIKYCQSKKNRAPEDIEICKQAITAEEETIAGLKELLPLQMNLNRLQTEEIPSVEREIEIAAENFPQAKSESEQAASAVTELKDKLSELQTLRRASTEILRLSREGQDLQRDVNKLESELKATGSVATADDIKEKVGAVTDKIRVAKLALDKISTDKQNQQNAILALERSIAATRMQLQEQRQRLNERENLEHEEETQRKSISSLESQLKEIDAELSRGLAPIQKLEDEMNSQIRDATQQEIYATRELQILTKSADELELNEKELQAYERRGGSKDLEKCKTDLERETAAIEEGEHRLEELRHQVSLADKELNDAAGILRNLNDNERLRADRRQLAEIDKELENLDEDDARRAYRKFGAEYNNQRQHQTNRQGEQAKLGGELAMLKNDLNEKKNELKTEYDQIEIRYKEALISVKCAEAANEDLSKYAAALDGAIMQFHSLKMAEINDTIADLWTKTYQGTDIDKIMIKSDAEGKVAGTRTSYNYRVVMFKDTTEMDMRGRCSAGQKVLASIIIRLALAESFGVNCGIMALDEPTTNLDKDNIKALASSLADLIKERRGQSNFQLIVITHDEEFLTEIGGSGVIDKYWRVSRGINGKVSTIEKQRL